MISYQLLNPETVPFMFLLCSSKIERFNVFEVSTLQKGTIMIMKTIINVQISSSPFNATGLFLVEQTYWGQVLFAALSGRAAAQEKFCQTFAKRVKLIPSLALQADTNT